MPVADAKILERVAQGLRAAQDLRAGHDARSADAGVGPAGSTVGTAATGADEARPAAVGAASAATSAKGSILAQAAAVYGAKPDQPEATPGTGFDPVAAALFEALVEGAFLVAHADGVVDAEERKAFEQVVASAASSGGTADRQGASAAHVHALLSDLGEALVEDGIDRRIEILTHTVTRPEHRSEVLRVAALVAHVSGGVSDPERRVMEKLAARLDLGPADIDRAIADATLALSG